jgi:hypothetical protein
MDDKNDISMPHGIQQNIKMELLGMIHHGESPFKIIGHMAKYLEGMSGEAGYAQIIEDNLRSIYGIALGEPYLLDAELHDVIERGKKLKAAYENDANSAEVKKRIEFALIRHRKRAEQLKILIQQKKEADACIANNET